jgi:DNA-binding NarL/FixJ family response regulator
MVLRVLVADDDVRVRSALRLVLEQLPGLTVVGELTSARALPRRVGRIRPDALFLDWEQPGVDDGAILPRLRASCPGLLVVALGSIPHARRSALAAGADYFIAKSDPPDVLLACVQALTTSGAPVRSAA